LVYDVGSRGVWKAKNSGSTWKPVFEKGKVYSIGCVTIDHNNPEVLYAAT